MTGWGITLALVSIVAGCNPSASDGAPVTPGGGGGAPPDGPGPEGIDEGGNSIGDLKVRLERLRAQQVEMSTNPDTSFGVCEDLCSLASSICSVKEKLCDVAEEHPGEEEYQNLCRKAQLECSESEESCVACVEARQQEGAEEASSP